MPSEILVYPNRGSALAIITAQFVDLASSSPRKAIPLGWNPAVPVEGAGARGLSDREDELRTEDRQQ